MATILNADTVTGGAVVTGDASGILELRAAGVTVLTLNSNGTATFAGATNVSPATANLVTTNTALQAGQAYRLVAASSVTLTLPASPATGDAINIMDGGCISYTVQPIVARNGKTIMGVAENMTLNISGIGFIIWYNGSDWRLF